MFSRKKKKSEPAPTLYTFTIYNRTPYTFKVGLKPASGTQNEDRVQRAHLKMSHVKFNVLEQDQFFELWYCDDEGRTLEVMTRLVRLPQENSFTIDNNFVFFHVPINAS